MLCGGIWRRPILASSEANEADALAFHGSQNLAVAQGLNLCQAFGTITGGQTFIKAGVAA